MSSVKPLEIDASESSLAHAPNRSAVGWALGLLLTLCAGWAGFNWMTPAAPPASLAQPSGSATPGGSAPAAATPLQQFTAGGHILGFGVGQVYLASGSHALQVQFVGAQPVSPQSDSAGGDGQQQKAPALSEVRYPGLWPGIDLTYRAASGGIAESVWRVAPGADLAQLRLHYNRPLALNPEGSLAIRFDTGVLNESAPVAWQEIDGQRRPVTVAFALYGADELGFTIGAYDPSRPVTIDPTLSWNTFLGNAGDDSGEDLAVDGSGYVYVTGTSTGNWGNPVRGAAGREDAFVAKLDASGALLWNTFLGGMNTDKGSGLAVDDSGYVYVSGRSYVSWGNPVGPPAGGGDTFIAKLDARSGALIWNTFLGGKLFDYGSCLAVDGSGHVYVTGASWGNWGSPVRPPSRARGMPLSPNWMRGAVRWSGTPSWVAGITIMALAWRSMAAAMSMSAALALALLQALGATGAVRCGPLRVGETPLSPNWLRGAAR